MRTFLVWVTVISVLLVVYHLVVYPAVLKLLGGRRRPTPPEVPSRRYRECAADVLLPTVGMVVPAFNEAEVIGDKIVNLATSDYPAARLQVVIICDGCRDATAERARAAAALPECRDLCLEIREFPINRGKVAVVNEAVTAMQTDLVALSDASTLISVDALLIGAHHFKDPKVGVVCARYELLDTCGNGEGSYWRYQTHIKELEASLGAVVGAHGAFYMFRKTLFDTIPADTINDDFVIPMSIVAKGFRAVYEPRMVALEVERFDQRQDFYRRQRIIAGNIQQVARFIKLLTPQFRGTAFAFASGKALRAILPFLMLISFLGSSALAASSSMFAILALAQGVAYGLVGIRQVMPHRKWPRAFESLHYLVFGQMAGLIGATRYLVGYKRNVWSAKHRDPSDETDVFKSWPLSNTAQFTEISYVHPAVMSAKRCIDIVVGAIGLVITAPVMVIIAFAIKLDSHGPVIYRQLRIGESRQDHTRLFFILKFRTMKANAEASTGATWASHDDPRETRVGRFLRRTRLDELPQLINVVRGEMSLIGPRPERPGFFGQLHDLIPYYCERITGVRPGITGFAQVYQAGDRTVDDVRTKLFYDHAYTLALSRPRAWLALELKIVRRTIPVMLFGSPLAPDAAMTSSLRPPGGNASHAPGDIGQRCV